MSDRPAFLNTSPAVWPMCTSDACKCGRKPCPTPDACWQPETPADRSWRVTDAIRALILVLVIAGLAAGLFEPEFWR